MSDQHQATEVDELVERLQRRMAEREAAGVYPPTLRADLDAAFERVVAHRTSTHDLTGLRERVEAVARAGAVTPAAISYESGLPGGDALHKLVGKAVSRQTAGVLSQVQALADSVVFALREAVEAMEQHTAQPHAELVGEIDALADRLSALERDSGDGPLGLADVRRRLHSLEEEAAERRFTSWYRASDFEERFRGTGPELVDRYRSLVAAFDGCDPVVDLGFGRGEFLQLLRERGVDCSGVEIDEALVRDAQARGFDVEIGEAASWLAAQADGSLGGLSMIQVIEHLTPGRREEIVHVAARKIRPGGRIVIETINPQSLYVFARAFYIDPTHVTPAHPAYLTFLVEQAGFHDVAIEWRSPVVDEERLQPIEARTPADRVYNENVDRLNGLLFGPQDYAIIATR